MTSMTNQAGSPCLDDRHLGPALRSDCHNGRLLNYHDRPKVEPSLILREALKSTLMDDRYEPGT